MDSRNPNGPIGKVWRLPNTKVEVSLSTGVVLLTRFAG